MLSHPCSELVRTSDHRILARRDSRQSPPPSPAIIGSCDWRRYSWPVRWACPGCGSGDLAARASPRSPSHRRRAGGARGLGHGHPRLVRRAAHGRRQRGRSVLPDPQRVLQRLRSAAAHPQPSPPPRRSTRPSRVARSSSPPTGSVRYVNALFRLTDRSGRGGQGGCGSGTGSTARTNFLIENGHIVQWLRAPDEPGDNGSPRRPPGSGTTTGPEHTDLAGHHARRRRAHRVTHREYA